MALRPERGIVLGFFQNRNAAAAVLKQLRDHGARRSASIHHATDGRFLVNDYDVTPQSGALIGGIAGLAIGLLFAALPMLVPALYSNPLNRLLLGIGLTAAGATIGVVLARLLDFGVPDPMIEHYKQWVVKGETLLVVHTRARKVARVATRMRQAEGEHPITFAFYPDRQYPAEAESELQTRDPLTSQKLSLEAGRLAAELHSVHSKAVHGQPLMRRITAAEQVIQQISQDLSNAAQQGRGVSISAEWLIDNSYIVQGHIDDFRRSLSRDFYRQLPVIDQGAHAGLPRVYTIAVELIADTDGRLDRDNINNFLQSYQSITPLTMGELWAVPLMLRLRLIQRLRYLTLQVERRHREREQADFWANRLLTVARRDPDRLPDYLANLNREVPEPSAYLADQLVGHLYDEEVTLTPVRAWLERKLATSLAEVIPQEHRREALEQASLANAITSLRCLSQLNWADIFEAVSRVDTILFTDPAQVYSRMDFNTRDRYRHMVEEITRRSKTAGMTELKVAYAALEMADEAHHAAETDPTMRPLLHHVGYYLVDEGRAALEKRVGSVPIFRERVLRWVRRHHTPVYLGGIVFLTLMLLAGFLGLTARIETSKGMLALLGVLAVIPLSEVAIQAIHLLITRLIPPQPLPKMSFRQGIPDAARSLVVVPTMLLTPESIREEVERLEIRYLANPDPNLRYALVTDYSDAQQQHMPDDVERLEIAVRGIEDLNARYAKDTPPRFFLFHREREWCESEGKWIGWERKRGKLEQLNAFLMGESSPALDNILRVGDPAQLRGLQFIVTLDADTQVPPGSVRCLVETLAHPLNRPILMTDTNGLPAVRRGYTILQPRVTTALPSANVSLFSRLFTDSAGTDPYTHVISDVYQDLAGQGSYHGKGIYDLRVFHTVLHDRFPKDAILSHDLIEGAHVRVGYVSDIETLDLFPRSYMIYAGRQHRWVRGDWQIMDWLFPTVPTGYGEEEGVDTAKIQNPKSKINNTLSLFNRWKIFDNLRRSLLPVFCLLLLLTGWLGLPSGSPVSLLVGIVLLLPPIIGLINLLAGLFRPHIRDAQVWRELGSNVLRALIFIALLPHQALLNLDAVCRVLWRKHLSRKLLLEWETAAEAHRRADDRQRQFLTGMVWIPISALLLNFAVQRLQPHDIRLSDLFLVAWVLSPLIVALLDSTAKPPQLLGILDGDEKRMVRQIARQTWRFFDDFVGPHTHWLPPDNYQENLRTEVAQRTSPTNIGLWLLCTVAARDFGYLTSDGVIERVGNTFDMLDKMEKYEGHLLNWYDLSTPEMALPLHPRYVSMVDSGNLLGMLWALEQSLDELSNAPLLSPLSLRGLTDTLALLKAIDGRSKESKEAPEGGTKGERGDKAEPKDRPFAADFDRAMKELDRLCSDPAQNLETLVRRLRALVEPVRRLSEAAKGMRENAGVAHVGPAPGREDERDAERIYWAEKVEDQVAEWNILIDRYLGWVEIISAPPEGGLLSISPEAHEWRRAALAAIPSLRTVAAGNVTGLRLLVALHEREIREKGIALSEDAHHWMDALAEAADRAKWLANEEVTRVDDVMTRTRKLADGMNFKFLYDPDRRLFYTGYNASDHRMDVGFYDLLASEARLGSFVCVARSEVPVEHWWALGRPFGQSVGGRALLSWSGTMFEYLMPHLLTRSFEHSLLDQAVRTAVETQMAYGKRRALPWGISEAAFSALDARQIYQYRAFGVPGLGMKRGLEEDLVISPYSTMLAMPVDPPAAVRNLRRLQRVPNPANPGGQMGRNGLRGKFGFYESIDYTRQEGPEGERGVIVYAYFSHHQGMSLLAMDNALNDGIFQQRFHSDPRVRAAESLLYEKIPVAPALLKGYVREAPGRLAPLSGGAASGRVEGMDTPAPRVGLLSNNTYSVMVTNAGGGVSRWKDFEITRWRADTTRDGYGSFCYIRDSESGAVWSAGFHPTRTNTTRYVALFAPEKVEIKRRDNGIETTTEILVSPEDNAEIRLFTLVNRSNRTRNLELTSYTEIALAPHNADRAHPAFSKLFVQTESLPRPGALLAWRRPRSANDPQIWAGHVVATETRFEEWTQYETDRSRFLGRGRTPENPIAIAQDLSGSTGAVLDPIFSLRRRITLEPGERVQVAFVTVAGETRDEVVALVEKYCDLTVAHRAVELAWTHAQLEMRHLRIQPDDALRYLQLAGPVLYPQSQMRPPADVLRRNTRSQSQLWAYGISGDLPTVVITIGDTEDIDMVRDVLMAHTFWRIRGLKVDLVILNQEAQSYDQPLQNQLRQMVQAYSPYTGMDQPGGVFLRPAAQIAPEDMTLLLTVARVVLVAARGPLAQQMAATTPAGPTMPALVRNPQAKEGPSPPLPFMELPYFNGYGGFTEDGKEYVIYLGPHDRTPAPWTNVMSNPRFGTMLTESGSGFSFYGNSQSNRMTPWSNDPVSDPPGDVLYLRDDDMGVVWTPTPLPVRELDAYRTRHGQGYTVFEHNSHAIEQELTVFVPGFLKPDETPDPADVSNVEGGVPVRIQRLRLRNISGRRRRLTLTSYAEWTLGVEREDTQLHTVTNWDGTSQSLFARNAYHPDFGGRVAFLASSHTPSSWTGDRTEFIGRNGALAAPTALQRAKLSGRVGAGFDPCGAIQVTIELEPNQQTEVVFLLGQANDTNEARAIIQQFRQPAVVDAALKTVKAGWDRLLGTLQVEVPDLAVDFLLNRWLLYQDLSCRTWARSAFYQSGGAYGFRDQLQDAMALVYAVPEITREQILRTAARQFLEGDVQHWWHPPSGAGVRTRISDDLLWLPFVTAHYVRVTGDAAILDAQIPFLEGKPLADNEHEVFNTPAVSQEQGTLLEHCRRAIAKGLTSGPHGLPLIGAGDWNDGLNRVGIEGKGESVWLAWFLIHVLHDFADLLDLHGEEKTAADYRSKAQVVAQAVEKSAWDGAWYRRAYFDDGTPLGSQESTEAKIDSLPQSWAVISGVADPARAEQALRSVETHLIRDKDKIVLLFTPPFDKTPHDPGYIKGYLPGVRENGGQYTHGSLWVPLAFARKGDGDRAVQILQLMNPVEHARTPEDVQKYKVEPYVVAADIYALEGQVGRGGWTWYTGSAGWMYRVWVEEVLGFHLRADTLTIDPRIAAEWEGFTLRYRYKTATYEIRVENPDHVNRGVIKIELDGASVSESHIPLADDGKMHKVRVQMGGTASRES